MPVILVKTQSDPAFQEAFQGNIPQGGGCSGGSGSRRMDALAIPMASWPTLSSPDSTCNSQQCTFTDIHLHYTKIAQAFFANHCVAMPGSCSSAWKAVEHPQSLPLQMSCPISFLLQLGFVENHPWENGRQILRSLFAHCTGHMSSHTAPSSSLDSTWQSAKTATLRHGS